MEEYEKNEWKENEKAKIKLQNKEEKISQRDWFISGRRKEEKEQKNEESEENMHKTKVKK